MTSDLSDRLEQARAAIRGDESSRGLRVLKRGDGATPVALLVTLGRENEALVFPLRHGRNLVGRGTGYFRPFGDLPEPYPLEQSQWIVECGNGEAQVRDAASTNSSYLVPSAVPIPTYERSIGFEAIHGVACAIPIAHPNEKSAQHVHPLREGDRLKSCYAWFLFGWL